ncbi:MAG: thioredoxin family protein [Firmicutes bacterium]|nr:thioredoxin family protein [Bacillota bacterium]
MGRKSTEGRIAIHVLEPEIEKCEALAMKAIDAVVGLPIFIDVTKVWDKEMIEKKFKVQETPGLAINGEVKATGKFPKKEQIRKWAKEESNIA